MYWERYATEDQETNSEYEEGLIKVIGTSDQYYKKKITKEMIKEDCNGRTYLTNYLRR